MWIDGRIVANLDIVANVSVGIDAAAAADNALLADVGEVTDIAAFTYLGRRGDEGRGIGARLLRSGLFHKVEQRGQRGVGVGHTQQSGIDMR